MPQVKRPAAGAIKGPYRLTFELPGLPKSPNALLGAHWTSRKRTADQTTSAVMAVVGRFKPVKPLAKAKLTLTRFSSSQPDFDGLVGSFKGTVDALVKIGVLENDKPSNLPGIEYFWEKAPPGQGKIKVQIRELEK